MSDYDYLNYFSDEEDSENNDIDSIKCINLLFKEKKEELDWFDSDEPKEFISTQPSNEEKINENKGYENLKEETQEIIIVVENIKEESLEKLEKNEEDIKPTRGRKPKNSKECGKHNKDQFDILLNKFKVRVFDSIYYGINNLLEKENIKDKILKTDGIITKETKLELNKLFFKSRIKTFLSYDISKKYKNYPKEYNKQIIDDLLKYSCNYRILDFLNLTIDNFISKYFMSDPQDFFDKYKIENPYLLYSLKTISNEEREMFKTQFEGGILETLKKKEGRNRSDPELKINRRKYFEYLIKENQKENQTNF